MRPNILLEVLGVKYCRTNCLLENEYRIIFTQKRFYTQTRLLKDAFTHHHFYKETFSHTHTHTHTHTLEHPEGRETWDEMRWGEMRWNEMRWDEMTWDEMRWDESWYRHVSFKASNSSQLTRASSAWHVGNWCECANNFGEAALGLAACHEDENADEVHCRVYVIENRWYPLCPGFSYTISRSGKCFGDRVLAFVMVLHVTPSVLKVALEKLANVDTVRGCRNADRQLCQGCHGYGVEAKFGVKHNSNWREKKSCHVNCYKHYNTLLGSKSDCPWQWLKLYPRCRRWNFSWFQVQRNSCMLWQSFKQVMTSVLVVVLELFLLELLVDVLDMLVLLVEMLDIEVLLLEVLVVGAGAGQRCAGSTCAGAVGWCAWSTTRRCAGSCSGQAWSACAGIAWCWLMYFCCFFRSWLRKCWKRWCRSRKCWRYLCWCCWLMCLR